MVSLDRESGNNWHRVGGAESSYITFPLKENLELSSLDGSGGGQIELVPFACQVVAVKAVEMNEVIDSLGLNEGKSNHTWHQKTQKEIWKFASIDK